MSDPEVEGSGLRFVMLDFEGCSPGTRFPNQQCIERGPT